MLDDKPITRATTSLDAEQKARKAASAASEAKAEEITLLDVRGISSITDFFMICTGTSQNHLRAVGKRIEDDLSEFGVKPSHVDGYNSTGWLVFDYGNVIVHAMAKDVRKLYDLERLWGDAPSFSFD